MKSSIIRHTTAIVALIIALFHSVTASAADTWSVNPSDYRYDMSLYLNVTFAAGEGLDYTQYDVAAFVGDECRGVAEVLPVPGGKDCLYLRARSNRESGETMTFRYRNKTTGEVKDIENVNFAFASNARLGYPSSPYEVKIVIYHDVIISTEGGGSVNESGGRLAEGTSLNLIATPDEGHYFSGWSDGSTENPRPLVVGTEDVALTATFALSQYHLTYTLDGETYKESDVLYGTTLTPEANPVKEGHTFSGWQGLPATMPAHDVEVTGNFTINSYKAVFKIGETVIDTKTIVFGDAVTAPEAPAKEGHTFAGWQDVPATMPARDIEVKGSYTVNKYNLVYKVDGAEHKSLEVEFGTTLTAEPNPVKEGHTFSGWQGLPTTMPAHDVEVTGNFTINSYKAVFKIGETVVETKTIVFGDAVTAPEAPAKEGHTFAGWQDVPETMPAHDIEVKGSYTVNKYNLVYKVDGAEHKSLEVEFGTTLTAEPNPVKEGHTFSGWQGLPTTMPAHDVEVTGNFTINSYKAVFKIGDDVIDTKTIVFGDAVTAPEAPAKEGHTFAGWQDVPATMPARDIEVNGSYTVNNYNLVYKVDGAEYKVVEVAFGATIVPEAAPEKEGYTFSGWQGLPETMPAHAVEVTGTFSINSYKAVFKIGNEIIDTKTIVFGDAVTAPEAPVKEGHTFAGWQDVPATMPARDIEIKGSYTVNKYAITYKVDGAEYKVVEVAFGTTIVPEADPVREGYTFSGWQGLPETMPAHAVEATGMFSINSYKAVFKIGDEIIDTKTIVFGDAVTAPEAPAKEGHTFAGWQDVPETMPARDIEIQGSYTVNKYALTYKVDGEEYKVVEVEFGTTIVPEADPVKEGYTFSGWQGLPETMPAHAVEATGTFSINSYKAVFKIGDDVIDTKTIVFGDAVTAPEAPAKEGHTFAGWQDVPETMPAHDIEIHGSYTVNKYALTYKVDGAEYKVVEVAFGTTIVPEADPVREGYTFSGWQGLPETMPAHAVEATGTFSINSYKAVFKIGDEIIDTKTIVFGDAVTAPEAPAKEGHTFAGWQDVPATMPAHDIEIQGSYTVNKYALTYKVDGEEYKVVEVEFGATIVPEADPVREGYTFSGWQGLPETMPANDVEVTATFSINSYRLTVYLDDEIYLEKTLEYGAAIELPDPKLPTDREFEGWDIEVPATMPAHDVEIRGTTRIVSGLAAIFADSETRLTVYTTNGVLLFRDKTVREASPLLKPGIYIVNGRKLVVK